ncbi:hypothetical protein Nepgr_003852 [Nepenthes gracilis]|uniref:Uncharacterized protein n=1 Tax=Nepenthes gracilis TaxID=150966 RepID=A0AAD3S0E4_NEPGR|nr:hypothetical protein Nepgr_003852 [Nepenthes gracilis]
MFENPGLKGVLPILDHSMPKASAASRGFVKDCSVVYNPPTSPSAHDVHFRLEVDPLCSPNLRCMDKANLSCPPVLLQIHCLRRFTADSDGPLGPGTVGLIDAVATAILTLLRLLWVLNSGRACALLALEWPFCCQWGCCNDSTSLCNHLMVADDGLGILLEWLMSWC